MPSEDTAGRRGPPHTGGRWQGRRSQAIEAAVNENCQFVVDPLTYPQLVQLTKKRRHVVVPP